MELRIIGLHIDLLPEIHGAFKKRIVEVGECYQSELSKFLDQIDEQFILYYTLHNFFTELNNEDLNPEYYFFYPITIKSETASDED